jgi:hypothetical protein
MLYTLMVDDPHASTDACDLDREFWTLQGLMDYIYDLSPDGAEIEYFVVHTSTESYFCADMESLEWLLNRYDPFYFERFVIYIVEGNGNA